MAPRARPLLALTFSTGVIDATCFVALGGVFAAMQTGNVVFLGIGAAGVAGAPFLAPLISLAAFIGGGLLAAAAIDERRSAEDTRAALMPRWLAFEAGLLALAALYALLTDASPGHTSAYLVIALLALTMGVRNTIVRGTAGPNLATTVLNLTLTTTTPGAALSTAGAEDLRERAGGLLAILLGAVAGALLAKSGLELALALATGAAIVAALLQRHRP